MGNFQVFHERTRCRLAVDGLMVVYHGNGRLIIIIYKLFEYVYMYLCIYRMTLVSKTTIRLDFLTHKTVHISIEIVIWFFQTTNISIAQVLMLWIILILSYIRVHINWFDIRIIFQWLGWVKPTPSIIIFVCCGIIQVGLLIWITLICVSCWLI